MSDIAARVRTIIVEKLGVEAALVVPEATFADSLSADSLDTIEIVMAFEDEFGIHIDDDKAAEITTVGAAIALIDAALASKAAAA